MCMCVYMNVCKYEGILIETRSSRYIDRLVLWSIAMRKLKVVCVGEKVCGEGRGWVLNTRLSLHTVYVCVERSECEAAAA